jgi:dephospho-CoA kinase
LLLGLTGGIGSGKSTVANLLVAHGAALIDADAISRATTAEGGVAIPLIRTEFGAAFLDQKGALDRERMRQHIFENPQARTRLERIIHPVVGIEIQAQTQIHIDTGKTCIVFDIPLLVESGHWRLRFNRVLVVDCQVATQVRRVTARNQLPAIEVQKILAAQVSRLVRLAAADDVICNDGISLAELAAQVHELAPQFGL